MHKYFRSIGDYAKDTRHLTLLEHGAYTLLLDLAYTTEKPLPADLTSLFRLCCARTKAEQDAVETVVKEFFQQCPEGGWIQNRVKRELAQYAGTGNVKRYGVFCRTWKSVHGKKAEVLEYEQWLEALPKFFDDHPIINGSSPDYQVMVTWYSRHAITHKPINQEPEPMFPPDYPATHVMALTRWWNYKRERKNAYKETAWTTLLKQQSRFTADQVSRSVEASIACNYAGLFTEKIAQADLRNPVPEKKEGGGAARHPLALPPCPEWKALAADLCERMGWEADMLPEMNWTDLDTEAKQAVVDEFNRRKAP